MSESVAQDRSGIRRVLEYRSVESLVPYAANARTHSDEQISQIAAAIKTFSFTNPVLLDEHNGIIAGHGRVMAAKRLGMAEVPCLVIAGLTEDEKRALVIADNKLALNAGWDEELLASELGALFESGFDLNLTGFSTDEINALLAGALPTGNTDPDDAPEPPVHPVTELGDVWILGNHRILCGDCTVATDVERVLAGVRPNLMVTDPPYGVNYDPSWRVKAGVADKVASGKVLNDDRADWREAWALFPGNVAYVWHAGIYAGVVEDSLKACKFRVRAQIVWVKTRHVLSRGHYHPQHEPCLYSVKDGEDDGWQGRGDPDRFAVEHEDVAYAVREGGTGEWRGGRKQSTVWYIEHLKSNTGHGTQKPVEAMKRPIENNSSPGQAVYEPFSGSGTTIIACEMTGRSCHAIELNPAYVDVAVRRWQEFTGKVAIHEATGLTFAEMAERRPIPASPAEAAE